jgi:hypothetical protein
LALAVCLSLRANGELGQAAVDTPLGKGRVVTPRLSEKGDVASRTSKVEEAIADEYQSEHTSYFDEDGRPRIIEQPPRQAEERFARERKSDYPERKHDP